MRSIKRLISIIMCMLLVVMSYPMVAVAAEKKLVEVSSSLTYNEIYEYNGNYYYLYPAKKWNDAKLFCESLGGHLLTVTSQGECNFIVSKFLAPNQITIALGLSDVKVEGKWEWVTGEEFVYSNWNSGEPNNLRDEDYALMFNDGKWNDGHANGEDWQFVCEWEDEPKKEIQYFNGHAYKVYHEQLDWDAAKEKCESLGGYLATVSSKEENDFITSMLIGNTYYLGGSDYKNEGTWEWVTGETWSYTNWDTLGYIEPDNLSNSDYLGIQGPGMAGTYNILGSWGDTLIRSTWLSGFVCEWDNNVYNPELNSSFIGTFENYVISVNLDAYGVNWISDITVDGTKYPVKQGALNLTHAQRMENEKVYVLVKNGLVESISTLDSTTSLKLDVSDDLTLTYKNGKFQNKKIDVSGSIANSIVTSIDKEIAQSIESLSLTDITVELLSSNKDIIYFKDNWFSGGKQHLTLSLGENIMPGELQPFSHKIYVNTKYDFSEDVQSDSVEVTYIVTAKKNGNVVTATDKISVSLVNCDYGINEEIKKNWKRQSITELFRQMRDKVKVCPALTEKERDELFWEITRYIESDTLGNLQLKYDMLDKVYEIDCYFYGRKYATIATAGEELLKAIIDECETVTDDMKKELDRELTMILQSLVKGDDFCKFVNWYGQDESQVILRNKKQSNINCPVDVTVTDEDGNIVLSIINDEVVFEAEGVSGYVHDGHKTIYLPTDIDHRIQIVATDEGTMDYSVTEYTASGDEVVTAYPDIVLTKDKVCTGDVAMESMPEEGSYELTEMTLDKLSFSGASLTLQDNICINFKANETLFTEIGYEEPFALFEVNGEKSVVSDYRIVDGKYVFDFADISPANMNDTVKATLYATYDGNVYVSETREYSVATYCYNMLSKYNTEEYSELRTLLVDLLNYGAATQIYEDYNTDNLVNANLTTEQLAWGTSETPVYKTVQNLTYATIDEPAVEWKGGGLNLKDSVEMRFKISANNYDNLRVVAETKDYTWTITSDTFEETTDGYYVFFDGMDASQMSEPVYLTVYDGNTAVSNTICYSIESYAYAKQNSTDEKLVNVLEAMMKYGNSAKAYVY